MPKLKLRKYITEGFVDHLKNNYGKYLAGAAAGATGGVYAGGQGYLGDDVKTNVQDLGYKAATDLIGRGLTNNTIENSVENPMLKDLGVAQIKLANGINNFTNVTESPLSISDRNPEANQQLASRVFDSAGNDITYLLKRLHKAVTPDQY